MGENELPAGERSTTPTGRRDQGTLQGMGNAASSGCFPSKKRAAAEAAAAEAEEPAAEELSDLEEEEVQPEQAAPSTAIESSPARRSRTSGTSSEWTRKFAPS